MASKPTSRPETPAPQRTANPQPAPSVYGGQWGSSGKQSGRTTGQPDPVAPGGGASKPG